MLLSTVLMMRINLDNDDFNLLEIMIYGCVIFSRPAQVRLLFVTCRKACNTGRNKRSDLLILLLS